MIQRSFNLKMEAISRARYLAAVAHPSTESTPLLVAAKYKQRDEVDQLIASGENLNCKDIEGWTVLHYAAFYGWLSTVKSLVEKGAELDAKLSTPCNATPLLLAADRDHASVVSFLIEAGADINCRDSKGTVLSYALAYGMVDVIRLLAKRGVDFDSRSLCDNFPLLEASKSYKKEVVQFLIDTGVDLNCKDKWGYTVLHHAAYHGWLSTVKSLVEKGAELDAKASPPFGDPLSAATPLLTAARQDHESVVLYLIEAGADISCRYRGDTVLSYALSYGMVDVVRMLANRGIDFDSRSLCDDFPLLEAAKWSQKEVVQFLIDSGVDRNRRCGEGGWTLMHFAARNRWPDVLQQTDAETAKQCAASDRGKTPLHVACEFMMMRFSESGLAGERFDAMAARAFVEVAELLFEKGFDVNARNSWVATPAHMAYHALVTRAVAEVETAAKLRVFNCLFEAGADCNIEDDDGKTLLDLFISTEEIELIRLAIEKGGYFRKEFSISTNIQQSILRDVWLCTTALVNKYNKMDLPAVYELRNLVDGKFPTLEKMKISIDGGVAKDIEAAVRRDIEERGYCNIFRISPLSLSLLVVNSILS